MRELASAAHASSEAGAEQALGQLCVKTGLSAAYTFFFLFPEHRLLIVIDKVIGIFIDID